LTSKVIISKLALFPPQWDVLARDLDSLASGIAGGSRCGLDALGFCGRSF
jgi:hypothetical protein